MTCLKRNIIAIAAVTISGLSVNVAALDRPNVIIVNVDNHSKTSLGYYGNKFIETPNIDSLFENGFRMENYQCAGRCTSSRAALLTGRYHARTGALGTGSSWERMSFGNPTLGSIFKDGGYKTAFFGKWHLGKSYPLFPQYQGFEEVCFIDNGATMSTAINKKGWDGNTRTSTDFQVCKNGEWITAKQFRTDFWFTNLIDYMKGLKESKEKKPFMVYLATITEHGPQDGPQDITEYYKKKFNSDGWNTKLPVKKSKSKKIKKNKKTPMPYEHAADIGNLDRNVGRLLQALKDLKLDKNTIVIYTSDGAGGGVGGMPVTRDESQSDTPFTCYVPGISPKAANKVCPDLTANIDIIPTLADLCDVKMPEKVSTELDGISRAHFIDPSKGEPVAKRTYIFDHQSSDNRVQDQMVITPFSNTQVYLPSGKSVKWVKGSMKAMGSGPEEIATAKEVYGKWLDRVLKDFPVYVYAQAGSSEANPLYVAGGYTIDNGPAGEGTLEYHPIEVLEDGNYELSTSSIGDLSYGKLKKTTKDSSQKYTLTLSRQKVDRLPFTLNEKTGRYQVMPAAFREYCETETQETGTPAVLNLKKGKYLINLKKMKGKKVSSMGYIKLTKVEE